MDGGVEKVRTLGHHADAGTDRLGIVSTQLLTVQPDAPCLVIPEAQEQVGQAHLPAPLGPTTASRPPGGTETVTPARAGGAAGL